MKLGLMALLTACVLFVTTNVFAFTVPTPTGHVTDTAHKLSSAQLAGLNSKAEAFERDTKNELAVLITDTLDGDTVEDVAYKTFNTWGVGKKGLDNGVLLVLAVKEHKSRIETGKGVGGELTDVQTQDILVSMRPFLRKDDFHGAVNFGMLEIKSKLDTRRAAKADPGQGARFNEPVVSTGTAPSCSVSSTASDVGFGFGLVVFFAVAVLLTVRYLIRSRKREEAELQAEIDRKSSLYLPLPVTATAASKPKQTLRVAPPLTDLPLPGSYRRSYPATPSPAPAYVPPPAPKPKAKKRHTPSSSSSSSSSSSYSSGSSYDSGSSGSSWGGGSDSGGGFGGGDSGGGGSSSDW
jgi:uncharacterized membrane protein YgcG